MKNKTAALLVLATAAALVVASTATYAMMGRQVASTPNGQGMGPSMMGRSNGYAGGTMGGYSGRSGGMMGGYGMMGAWNGMNSMYDHMQDMRGYLQHHWNSTAP